VFIKSSFSYKRWVQQRRLEPRHRGVLPRVAVGEAVGFFSEFVALCHHDLLLDDSRKKNQRLRDPFFCDEIDPLSFLTLFKIYASQNETGNGYSQTGIPIYQNFYYTRSRWVYTNTKKKNEIYLQQPPKGRATMSQNERARYKTLPE
jgi:hypothetical protein